MESTTLSRRIKGKTFVLIIVIALAIAALCALPFTAYGAAGQVPDHNKTLTPNGVTEDNPDGDGTYKLALSVTGDAIDEIQKNGSANVVVVYDVSQSMTNRTGGFGSPSRADQAEDIVHDFLANLNTYKQQGSDIEVSLVTFSRTASIEVGWTSGVADLADDFDDGGTDGRVNFTYDSYPANYGTNWEQALVQAETLLSRLTDNDPTFVIFITDGAPTANGVNGNDPGNPENMNWNQFVNRYNYACGPAQRINQTVTSKGGAFYGIYAYGTEADLLDDLMYYAQNGQNNPNMSAATDHTVPNYFNAENTAALTRAIDSIFNAVIKALGITEVSISDGTTNSVSVSTGDPLELLEVAGNYEYTLDIPLVDGKFERTEIVGGQETTVVYTVTDRGNDNVRVTWGDSGVADVHGSVSSGVFHYKWEGPAGFYNYAPPAAQLVDGVVKWNLSPVGTLLNGVTYTVSFDVYPSQKTLDWKAKIENDEPYDQVVPEAAQQYFKEDGSLVTNTKATLSYKDSRLPDDQQPDPVEYAPPEKIVTKAETMTVTKSWEPYTPSDITELELRVVADGETDPPFEEVTFGNEQGWTQEIYISCGIITNGKVMEGSEGHDFTFDELPSIQYRWELEAPTMHPMMIDGTPTMLVKVDAEHQPSSPDDVITIGEGQYYIDNSITVLEAVNHRRSNLNLSKVVTSEEGSTAPANATFPFTLTVFNSKDGNGSVDDINSDYYVWFSVQNNDIYCERTTNATLRPDPLTGDPWYYAPSGSAITINLKAGDSLRFTNLPSGTTYTFTEGNTTGFSFVKIENTASDPEHTTFNVDGKTVSGKIDTYDAVAYGAQYTNTYGTTDVTVTKQWDDGDNQDNIRPDSINLTLAGYPGTPVPVPEVTKDGNTWTYTWENLPKYGTTGNEIEYHVTEQRVDGYEAPNYGEGNTYAVDGGTIINKHTPVNTSITVIKEWVDANNQDGFRPDSIFVQLYANDIASGEPVEISADSEDGAWTYTWRGLPKNVGGQTVEYTVDETKEPEHYTKTGITGDMATGFTITNKHTPEQTSVKVTKAWDGPAGNSVEVQLYADEEAYGEPVTITANDNWTHTWTGLDKYANGKEIKYTVDETSVPTGYAKKNPIDVDEDGGFVITNINTEKVEKTVKKVWYDGENQDGIRPDSLSVQLRADGEDYGNPVELTPDRNWTATVTGLPKYNGADEIEYTWVEDQDDLPEGYAPAEPSSSVDGNTTTLYNEHTPEKTSVKVTKAWDDSDNAGGVRPSSISVQLYADEEPYGEAVELTADKNWTHTWTGLDKKKAGELIEYTVDETSVPKGYTEKDPIDVDEDGNFTITNTYTPEATEYELYAGKKLEAKSPANNPPDVSGKYTLTLEAVGSAPMPENAVDGKVEITNIDGDGTMASFGEIPFTAPGEYQYTVSEAASETIPGVTNGQTSYTVKVKVSGTIEGGLSCKVIEGAQKTLFTNTYKVTPATATVEATKELTGAPLASGAFNFELVDDDGEQAATATNGVGDDPSKVAFDKMTFDAPGTYTFTMKEVDGEKGGYTYDDKEVTVTITVSDNGKGELVATPSYDGSTTPPTFNNSYKAEGGVDLSIKKEFTNGSLEDKHFTFKLIDESGEPIQTKQSDDYGAVVFDRIDYDQSIFDKEAPSEPDDEGTYGPSSDEDEAAVDDTVDESKATEGDEPEEKVGEPKENDPSAADDDSEAATDDEPAGENDTSADAQASATKVMADGDDEGDDTGDNEDKPTVKVTYTIHEVTGDETYIDYDTAGDITVTVTVVDNGDGTITATPEYSRTQFTNTYKATGSATFEGTKTLEGADLAEGQFSFQLIDSSNEAIQEVKNAADGSFSFDAIAYDATDIGKTYEYQIVEVNDGQAGYTYDERVYTAKVEVSDAGEGELDCKVTLSVGDEEVDKVAFENTFKPLSTSVQLQGTKVLENRELFAEEFYFTLEGDTVSELVLVTNDAAGNIDFGTYEFEEEGTYTFTATELDTGEEGITYDTSAQEFTVMVELVDGELVATVSCGEGEKAQFTNTFKQDGPPNNPDNPDDPDNGNNGNNGSGSNGSNGGGNGKSPLPNTGDSAPIIPLLLMALIGVITVAFITARRLSPATRGQHARSGKGQRR